MDIKTFLNSFCCAAIKNSLAGSRFSFGKCRGKWENGWGGSGGFQRIFGFFCWKSMPFPTEGQQKSVEIRPIRPIRSPIVSLFSKGEIAAGNKFPDYHSTSKDKATFFTIISRTDKIIQKRL